MIHERVVPGTGVSIVSVQVDKYPTTLKNMPHIVDYFAACGLHSEVFETLQTPGKVLVLSRVT